jgi:hypothetical protein
MLPGLYALWIGYITSGDFNVFLNVCLNCFTFSSQKSAHYVIQLGKSRACLTCFELKLQNATSRNLTVRLCPASPVMSLPGTQDVPYFGGLASWPTDGVFFFINTVHVILGMGGTKICTELFMKIQVFRHESSCIKRQIQCRKCTKTHLRASVIPKQEAQLSQ